MNITQYAQGVLVVSGDSSKKLSKPLKTFNPPLDELPVNPFGVGTQDAINTGIFADSADLGDSKAGFVEQVPATTETTEAPATETTEAPATETTEAPATETTETTETTEAPATETAETK